MGDRARQRDSLAGIALFFAGEALVTLVLAGVTAWISVGVQCENQTGSGGAACGFWREHALTAIVLATAPLGLALAVAMIRRSSTPLVLGAVF